MQYKYDVAFIESSLNGAFLKPTVARKMKLEGMFAGTSDLKVFHKGGVIHIEMKAPTVYGMSPKTGKRIIKKAGGKQSEVQEHYQKLVERFNQPYYLCDTLEDFIKICKKHIDND